MTAPTVTRAVREALDPACTYCGTECEPEAEHVIPAAQGGASHAANIAPACHDCNAEKRDRTPDEWAADRVRVGLAWPPPGHAAFGLALAAAAEPDELDLLAEALVDQRNDAAMSELVGDCYRAYRSNPVFEPRTGIDLLLAAVRETERAS